MYWLLAALLIVVGALLPAATAFLGLGENTWLGSVPLYSLYTIPIGAVLLLIEIVLWVIYG